MATCPECSTDYPEGVGVCEKDGTPLGPEDRELAAGERVGEYEIESKIGQGGFGSVYRAVHPLIGKSAAIKVLGHKFSADREMLSRFVAEARSVNRIKHKNIIDIFAFGKLPDGRHYYVMELLDGTTLDRHLGQNARLSIEEAFPILLGVARALDAAHAAGIVHRDLKPENVFLAHDQDRGHDPKLLDFGIAKLFGDPTRQHQTRTGVPMGTPAYMSPEQCRGLAVDHRTDVYSFGVMAYRMLSGWLPFVADSAMDVMMMHVSKPPPPASSHGPGLSPEIDAVLAHLLEKDPEKRPESVGGALSELVRAARAAGHEVSMPQTFSVSPRSGSDSMASAPTLPITDAHRSADTLARATTASVPADTVRPGPSRRPVLIALVAVVGLAAAAFVWARRGAAPEREGASPSALRSSELQVPATSTPTAETAPAEVELTVESEPAGVEVFAGERKLGAAPGPFRVPKSAQKLTLVFKANGFVAKELEIAPNANRVLTIKLDKAPRTAPAPAGKKPEVEF